MDVFENFENQLKANPKTIVFTEGTDARILSAASKLLAGKILNVLLLGNPEAVKKAAAEGGFDITGAEICDPTSYPEFDAMVAKMVELRKGKMTEEQCRAALSKSNYFGTMLVKMGKADCLLGGATYSTADTVRPALQLIKTKPGNNIVSSCFIMVKDDQKLAMGDCAINIAPNEDELVEIAVETAKTAKVFGIDPKVAMLSYSTYGSGKGDMVTLVANATKKIKEAAPDLAVDGELQFDAAVAPDGDPERMGKTHTPCKAWRRVYERKDTCKTFRRKASDTDGAFSEKKRETEAVSSDDTKRQAQESRRP